MSMILDRIRGEQRGVSLIETAIAMAILGIIAVAFLCGLATVFRAVIIADEQATANNLARSGMEWVKSSLYATSYTWTSMPSGNDYVGYTVTIGAEALTAPNVQKVTVTVQRNGRTVMTTEGYKANR